MPKCLPAVALLGLADYPGINGFLGSRASIMLDVVFLAMFLVLPLVGIGIGLARFRRRYTWHKRMQLTLAAVLLLTVAAFEIDMQWISGWREQAQPSPFWPMGVKSSLYIHLVFSISTFLLWLYVVFGRCETFPNHRSPRRTAAGMCSGHASRPSIWC